MFGKKEDTPNVNVSHPYLSLSLSLSKRERQHINHKDKIELIYFDNIYIILLAIVIEYIFFQSLTNKFDFPFIIDLGVDLAFHHFLMANLNLPSPIIDQLHALHER